MKLSRRSMPIRNFSEILSELTEKKKPRRFIYPKEYKEVDLLTTKSHKHGKMDELETPIPPLKNYKPSKS